MQLVSFEPSTRRGSMTFYSFGLNHECAPIGVREGFALSKNLKRTLYREASLAPGSEFVLLSTCNRTEIYLFGEESDVDVLKQAVSERAGIPWPESQSFLLESEEAIFHVIQVAAGLKSQVLGDGQILNQIKDAYRLAAEEARIGTVMHRLMHTSFRAAKNVLSETSIAQGAASVSSLAVAAAREHFKSDFGHGLNGKTVLLLGTGEMGMLVLRSLGIQGLKNVFVSNRSPNGAREAATKIDGTVVSWDDRYDIAGEVDVVVVATGAEEPVLRAEAMPDRSEKPLLLIDIALPRNIDPAVADLPGCTLIDLDGLNVWLSKIERMRRSDLPRAMDICRESLAEFVAWVLHQQALQPAIQTLKATFDAIRIQEIQRHIGRFNEIDYAELDRITRSIMQKLLSIPIVRLKDSAEDELSLKLRIELLNSLFSRPECEDATELTGLPAAPSDEERRSAGGNDATSEESFSMQGPDRLDKG